MTRREPGDPASRSSVAEAVNKAALMRESALKSVIFVGVPRVSWIELSVPYFEFAFEH